MLMKLLILLPLLFGCAYGTIPDQQQKSYSNGQAPGSIDSGDAGSSNWGDNSNNGLPRGCFWEDVIEHQQLVASFIICMENPEMTYKWLVDPPPDGINLKNEK